EPYAILRRRCLAYADRYVHNAWAIGVPKPDTPGNGYRTSPFTLPYVRCPSCRSVPVAAVLSHEPARETLCIVGWTPGCRANCPGNVSSTRRSATDRNYFPHLCPYLYIVHIPAYVHPIF